MFISVIGVPTFYGCDKDGPQFGPKKLREKNIIEVIKKHNHKVYDLGDICIDSVDEKDKFLFDNNMKYSKAILETNTNLAHATYTTLKANSFAFILGGDHSIGTGSIAGASRFHKNIGVIWFDAHGDLNTPESSDSKNVHGMPLASSIGYGDKKFVNTYFDGIKVKEENVFHIGGRDLDDGEINLIKNTKINAYTPDDIRHSGIDSIVNEILNKARKSNIDAFHLSFDLDFIDAKYVPGTGTRVDDGFTVEESKEFLSKLVSTGLIKSMDLVELNPLLDVDDTTSDIAIELTDTVFECMKF